MKHVLEVAVAHATGYLDSLSSRPIAAKASIEELRVSALSTGAGDEY